jgi:hypothetical protein
MKHAISIVLATGTIANPAFALEPPQQAVTWYLAHPETIPPVLEWCKANLYAPATQPDPATLGKLLDQAQSCMDASTAVAVIVRAQRIEELKRSGGGQ